MGATQSGSGQSWAVSSASAGAQRPLGQLFSVPLEILEEIFLNLPPCHVVCVCRLVSHQWKEVADCESLWRVKCRREGYHPKDASKVLSDWRLFYFLCRKRRNLLKNPRGEDGMKDWQIMENGGNQWKIEGLMVPHPNEKIQTNFVTSYGMCRKAQLINLAKEGYSSAFMDEFQPDIKVTDWYAPRWDCGSEYSVSVQLINGKRKVVKQYKPDTVYFEQWNDQQWNEISHIFRDYGPGVRYIRFIHGGKDTQFWAGWYGIRVTGSCIEICPREDAAVLNSNPVASSHHSCT